MAGQVVVCDHPLIRQALGELRRRETPPLEFRARVGELSRYLSYEAARDVEVERVEVETPLTRTVAAVAGDPGRSSGTATAFSV